MNAQETKAVEKIRAGYTKKEPTKLEELKALDRKVSRPAKVFAYTFGTVGSLVLGTGMCLAMKVIGDLMIPGIAIGLVGIGMVSATYQLHNAILASRKRRYADEVVALTDELLGK